MTHHNNPNSLEDNILNANVSGTSGRVLKQIQRWKVNMLMQQQPQKQPGYLVCLQEPQLPQLLVPPRLAKKPRRAPQNRNESASLRGLANMFALTADVLVQSPVSFRNISAPTLENVLILAPHAASRLRPRVTCTNTANHIPTG